MAKVEKQQRFEKKLYWGVDQFSYEALNPTRSELNKLLGIEDKDDDKDIEYLKDDYELKTKDAEGNESSEFVTRLNVVFWLRGSKTNQLFPITFSVYKKPSISKTGKTQYINQFGRSSFVDSEENLKEFFTTCKYKASKYDDEQLIPLKYRVANKGEAELLEFIAKFLALNTFNPNNNLFLEDYNKFWKGNMGELKELLSSFKESNTIACLMGIRHKDVENKDTGDIENKQFQIVSGRFCFPGHLMKYFRNYSKKGFDNVPKKVGYDSLYELNSFLENVQNPEYGFEGAYVLREVEEYNAEEDALASNEANISDDSPKY